MTYPTPTTRDLMARAVSDIPEQSWIGPTEPTEDAFTQPENPDDLLHKPEGGLWTSTLTEEDGTPTSRWLKWCQSERWGIAEDDVLWSLNPEDDLRMFQIADHSDLIALLGAYERDSHPLAGLSFAVIDFEVMAKNWDGIWLTAEGQRQTRLTEPNLYGWDSECICWLDWCFEATSKVRELDPETEYVEPRY